MKGINIERTIQEIYTRKLIDLHKSKQGNTTNENIYSLK